MTSDVLWIHFTSILSSKQPHKLTSWPFWKWQNLWASPGPHPILHWINVQRGKSRTCSASILPWSSITRDIQVTHSSQSLQYSGRTTPKCHTRPLRWQHFVARNVSPLGECPGFHYIPAPLGAGCCGTKLSTLQGAVQCWFLCLFISFLILALYVMELAEILLILVLNQPDLELDCCGTSKYWGS